MFTDNYDSSFCFWLFEKRLTQDNRFLFCKKYALFDGSMFLKINKGPVKLMKRVKIAHSFLQLVSNQFHVIVLSFPMYFYKWLSKNFSTPTSKNGDIGHFNL